MTTKAEFTQRMAVLIADQLEASGAAPWGATPAPTLVSASGNGDGECACATFFRTFGQRNYQWEELPDLERKAWEDVAATLGRGVGSVDVMALEDKARSKEREECAMVIDMLLRETGQAHAQILVYAATRIRRR